MVMHYYKEHHHPSSISDVEEFQFAPSRSHLRRRSSVAFSLLTTVFIGLLVLFLLNSYSKPIVSSRLVIHIMDNYTGRNCQLVLDTKMRNAKWITTRGQLLYATHFFHILFQFLSFYELYVLMKSTHRHKMDGFAR